MQFLSHTMEVPFLIFVEIIRKIKWLVTFPIVVHNTAALPAQTLLIFYNFRVISR